MAATGQVPANLGPRRQGLPSRDVEDDLQGDAALRRRGALLGLCVRDRNELKHLLMCPKSLMEKVLFPKSVQQRTLDFFSSPPLHHVIMWEGSKKKKISPAIIGPTAVTIPVFFIPHSFHTARQWSAIPSFSLPLFSLELELWRSRN